jgi:D-beta-D-heptose 7-phosphate kinase/D-beta-D-heptose 1-phosphate adenosyltransferase
VILKLLVVLRIVFGYLRVARVVRQARLKSLDADAAEVAAAACSALAAARVAVLSDYGKGVLTPRTLERGLGAARRHGVRISVDPKESHIDAYRGISILTPNQHEAGYIQGRRIVDEASLTEVGWGLQERLDAEAVLVTRGAEGMSLFEKGGRYTHLPTVAREVYDVTGAGDTVVGVVALALAAGADFPTASRLSNHAAGVVIREVGTAACTPAQLLDSLADGRR